MAEVGFELLKELGVLNVGRNPVVSEQLPLESGASSDAPSGDVGINMTDSVICYYGVELQRDARFQTTGVTVVVIDTTATYTVTINGTPSNYPANLGDGITEILNGLAAQIALSGEPVSTSIVTEGNLPTLLVTSTTGATFTLTVGATGTGVLADSFDATTVDFQVWGRLKTRSAWCLLPEGTFTGQTTNVCDRMGVAGFDRIFIRVTATDGHVQPFLAPAELE
jgi:hypothetical protein